MPPGPYLPRKYLPRSTRLGLPKRLGMANMNPRRTRQKEIAVALRMSAKRAEHGVRTEGSGDLASTVVDEITWFMREHKISRADLAHSLAVSPGRVSQILSGDENLTLRTLSSVVGCLGARVEVTLQPLEEPDELLD
jgi:antitoxin component HigA of HigAB toxin-antitoxin module